MTWAGPSDLVLLAAGPRNRAISVERANFEPAMRRPESTVDGTLTRTFFWDPLGLGSDEDCGGRKPQWCPVGGISV